MPVLPPEFQSAIFPEINGTVNFRGLTYIFFEQFTLPTSEQLDFMSTQLPGWSLITWGWWDGEADIEDQDIESITEDTDSLEQLSEDGEKSALATFNLNSDGTPDGSRTAQLAVPAPNLTDIFAEQGNWGLVAISCPNWTTVAACEWRGCMNIAEPHEIALTLRRWNANWGVEVLAFGGEEDDADLLLHIPADHADNPDMFHSFAVAADEVTSYTDGELGQLISLWFD